MLDVPLLVDGAHSPGNGRCNPSRYPMWVGSGHKWLGGPNGTGFAYVAPHLVPWLEPVNIGDKYFEMKEADVDDITRFESLGTTDVVRWYGLARACQLQMELGLDFVKSKQVKLMRYVREKIDEVLGAQFRTPDLSDEESTGMVTFLFPQERLIVEDLRESLWKEYRIWVQPDFINVANPGHGMRISCHINNTEDDINALVEAISSFVL
jgi:selenocysteine lyase/cysteine desulfurase